MTQQLTVKTVLKRGALVAAANWQVTAIQFVVDSTVKLLVTVPIVGGVLTVALVLGRDLPDFLADDLRSSLTGVASALVAEPIALGAFLVSLGIVGAAGSVLMFLAKGGTVTVLAKGEREAGLVEEPPLRLPVFWSGARFSIDGFRDGCTNLFRRYLRLGLVLFGVYAVSAAVYLGALFGALPASMTPESNVAWTLTAGLASTVLAAWITVANFLYLLIQMVVAVEDCSVRNAAKRVYRFLCAAPRLVLSVFGLVLVLVVGATIISLVATTSLGLIAFVPLVGLAVVPLQLLAWLFRGLIFQYLGLSALGAYMNVYRHHLTDAPEEAVAALDDPSPFSG